MTPSAACYIIAQNNGAWLRVGIGAYAKAGYRHGEASTAGWRRLDYSVTKLHDLLITESDPKKAEEITRALARRAHEEQYLTVLYRNVTVYAMRNQVQFTPMVQSQYVELRNMGWK